MNTMMGGQADNSRKILIYGCKLHKKGTLTSIKTQSALFIRTVEHKKRIAQSNQSQLSIHFQIFFCQSATKSYFLLDCVTNQTLYSECMIFPILRAPQNLDLERRTSAGGVMSNVTWIHANIIHILQWHRGRQQSSGRICCIWNHYRSGFWLSGVNVLSSNGSNLMSYQGKATSSGHLKTTQPCSFTYKITQQLTINLNMQLICSKTICCCSFSAASQPPSVALPYEMPKFGMKLKLQN